MQNIRLAKPSDSEAILAIYAPYITDTAVSFETAVPSADAFAARIETIMAVYPFLVYETDGGIVGYAYASRHRERAAYQYDVDVSVYVLPAFHGAGVAYQLYDGLFALLGALGYRNAYAAYTEPNPKSERFHRKFGFTRIGTHHQTGYKLGKWHDVTWLEKQITKHTPGDNSGNDEKPGKILSIRDISPVYLKQLLLGETCG